MSKRIQCPAPNFKTASISLTNALVALGIAQSTTGVGAVHIPGTPTGANSGSWMLACIGSGVNRPFNTNDVTALNYVY